MKEYVFSVGGMSCPMCESHVNDAVRNAFPVRSVRSDRRKGRTTVVAEELDAGAVARAITASGYDASLLSEAPYQKPSLFGRRKR